MFFFIVSGLPLSNIDIEPVTQEIADAVSGVIAQISEYTTDLSHPIDSIQYPALLDECISASKDVRLLSFNSEMKKGQWIFCSLSG